MSDTDYVWAREDELLEEFAALEGEVSNAVIQKSLEMCQTYLINAENFVNEWLAFKASEPNGDTMTVTVETLERMELKEFKAIKKEKVTPLKPKLNSKLKIQPSDDEEDLILAAYHAKESPSTPKAKRSLIKEEPLTPKRELLTPKRLNDEPVKSIYGSPGASKGLNFIQRSDAKHVQCFHGPPTASFQRENDQELTVKLVGEEFLNNTKYMKETMRDISDTIDYVTECIGNMILGKYNLFPSEGSLKSNQGEMTVFGRIVSDCDNKINVQSCLLEASSKYNYSQTVSLNLTSVSRYSLFPGQVAVVQGKSYNTTFYAKNIITDACPMLPTEAPKLTGTLQICVASGPFTFSSNLSYEPFYELIKYVTENKPNLLILLGPFLDMDHECLFDDTLVDTSPEQIFEELIEKLMSQLVEFNIEVVIVSNHNEAHHHPIYPTPPYSISKNHKNLTFVSDPCMININGLYIGATTADILWHMSSYEIFQDKSGNTDRLGRLASHLLNQRSFYPLYPPNEDMSVNLDLLEKFGVIDVVPHILILPSNLRNFVKNVNGCLVINPERLVKGYGGGSFARIEVTTGTSTSICNRTACQVLKI